MCGINGFIKPNINQKEAIGLLNQMNQIINHRGPDDDGIFVDNIGNYTVGLGHVRLSIIDLTNSGHQPMFYHKTFGASNDKFLVHQNKNLCIVFNGEIYNFNEIKQDLEKKGYKFSGKSDTEVILASYLEYQEQCVNQFNGMWAFVIYDEINNKLFASRDRLGKKPFYYYFDGENFIFSSQPKGILKHIKQNIDTNALDFYLTTGFIPSPWTIYKDIKKLEARHSLVIKINEKLSIQKYCYYDIPKYKPIYDKDFLINEGKKILEDSTKIRMFADVPVGAFLSGGLDSSTVVGVMRHFNTNLHTFSIGFEGSYDETNYINIVKDYFKTNHHHKYFVQQDFESMLDDIYDFYDEPFADYSNFPTTFVCKLAKEFVKVSLSGDGGDEIFGGYYMYKIGAQMDLIYSLPKWIKKIFYYSIPKTKNNLSVFSKLKEAFRLGNEPKNRFYCDIGGNSIYKPDIYKTWVEAKFTEILDKNDGNFLQTMIDFDLFYNTMADNFLVKVDRASMAVGVEVRSPFLDYRWIEWSRKVPVEYKVSIFETKKIMKEIIKDIVPKKILTRGKKGFEPPIRDWILQEKYMKMIENGLENLHNLGILNQNWYSFYKEIALKQNNSLFNVYKIRLFLFIKWFEKWIN